MEVNANELRATVEKLHTCTARLVGFAPVTESIDGQSAWEGLVHVFALDGHPAADRAYAWSLPTRDDGQRRVISVLHRSPITSPSEAVRAAIAGGSRMTEHRS